MWEALRIFGLIIVAAFLVMAIIDQTILRIKSAFDHCVVFYFLAKKNFLMELGKEEIPKVKNLSGLM